VEAVNVNATAPHSTKINYHVEPSNAIIESATFTAPGKTETKTNLSGDFYFTYDQADLATGSNTIRLEYSTKTLDVTATRENKLTPQETEIVTAFFAIEGVGSRIYTHKLNEIYHKVSYSISYSGYTIWIGKGHAALFVGEDYYTISTGIGISGAGWAESHKYTWANGGTNYQGMTHSEGMGNPQTLYKQCSDNLWPLSGGIVGIARVNSLIYQSGGGFYPAIPILNREIDRSIP